MDITADNLVYTNNFQTNSLHGLEGGVLDTLSDNILIGQYNNGVVTLSVDDLPEHNFIEIEFDLYIHDSWDGNRGGVNGPDIWGMEITDPGFLSSSSYTFRTTFSNSSCGGSHCLRQSYPAPYYFSNDPKAGSAYLTNGVHLLVGSSTGTTVYHISKLIPHQNQSVRFRFYDELKQDNSPDPLFDESWSMDNLEVRTLLIR